MMSQTAYHIPALLRESIEALEIVPDGIYVDATFGGGGHSKSILEKLGEKGHLYSFDQDEDAVKRAFADEKFTIVYSNFKYLANFMRYYGISSVDGILADLGVSSHHFDDKERGFSYRWEGSLDMRMNRKGTRTASWIIANYTAQQLQNMLYYQGELKNARRIASEIAKAREVSPIDSVEKLLKVVSPLINPRQEKKELSQLFQALRIEVNGEGEAVRQFLIHSLDLLKPGGRVAIISYLSLEDRLVKNFMRSGNAEGTLEKDFFGHVCSPLKLITTKPIVPSGEEVSRNPRSRSAKLRVAEKI